MNQYTQPVSQPASPPLVPDETMRRILRTVELHRPHADALAISMAVNLTWAAKNRLEWVANHAD